MTDFDSLLPLWSKNQSNTLLLADLLSCSLREGKPEQANALIEQLGNPASIEAKFAVVVVEYLLNSGQFQAVTSYLPVLEHSVEHRSAFVYYSLVQLFLLNKLDDISDFHSTYQSEIQSSPSSKLLVARALYMQLKVEQALSLLQDDMEHPEINELKSLLYFEVGQFDQVRVCAEAALRELPDSYLARIALASLFIEQRHYRQAGELVDYCIHRFPNQGRAWALKGQLAFEKLDFVASRDALRTATSLMPAHLGSWHMLAWTEYLLGDKQAAFAAFRAAFTTDPTFADSQAGMAIVALDNNDIDSAEVFVDKAIRLDKRGFTGRYAHALLLNAKGETAQAEQLIQLMLKASAEDGVSFQRLILEKLEKVQDSKTHG